MGGGERMRRAKPRRRNGGRHERRNAVQRPSVPQQPWWCLCILLTGKARQACLLQILRPLLCSTASVLFILLAALISVLPPNRVRLHPHVLPLHQIALLKSKPLNSGAVALKRSKSVAPQHLPAPLLNNVASNSPRKKSFCSFLTLVHSSSATIPSTATKRRSTSYPSPSSSNAGIGRDLPKETKNGRKSETSSSSSAAAVATDDDPIPGGSQASASFGRKVARSRSVGCGSRSSVTFSSGSPTD
ncbi:hypothetical protein HPP92_021363 [Vanilla planifolia]|uniref:Uncharacterized protein n=1 Tax=Vanilla planifolia TaxID=51239 RepID=A0A835UIW5_VANPL|nr:hypothetical protein HPP92_021363 [Vanilla planifolia]